MLAHPKHNHKPETGAKQAYARLLEKVRQEGFYREGGVADNFDGRFDLLVLHAFLVMDVLKSQSPQFNQSLFDTMFADMDQVLRERGIGDMGIPKHMRRMMKAFNGRAHVYETAMKEGTLPEALRKNLYGDKNPPGISQLEKMVQYCKDQSAFIAAQDPEKILSGHLELKEWK